MIIDNAAPTATVFGLFGSCFGILLGFIIWGAK